MRFKKLFEFLDAEAENFRRQRMNLHKQLDAERTKFPVNTENIDRIKKQLSDLQDKYHKAIEKKAKEK